MTEGEFLVLTDAVFARIETCLDEQDLDIDSLRAGNVLELECDDGSKVIVNRHTPNQELWLAARNGGFHYRWQAGRWCSTRGEGEFFADLSAALSLHAGEPVVVSAA
ncbi:iron donor protein CyaY [Chitinilyticum piscinae]|uniref:Iron-sulfur cluster assembly protein CyaY n=1 Tax=Chitinilyticum piscinae TaxID=2866724 RepID=A0A8J7G1B4_9NEIS|nr:iron donor protein CyaY [Chitinilyticum piscinae]MBE9610160.1 iron donor protein CyaY [Chitinilyticum piscinae]